MALLDFLNNKLALKEAPLYPIDAHDENFVTDDVLVLTINAHGDLPRRRSDVLDVMDPRAGTFDARALLQNQGVGSNVVEV